MTQPCVFPDKCSHPKKWTKFELTRNPIWQSLALMWPQSRANREFPCSPDSPGHKKTYADGDTRAGLLEILLQNMGKHDCSNTSKYAAVRLTRITPCLDSVKEK